MEWPRCEDSCGKKEENVDLGEKIDDTRARNAEMTARCKLVEHRLRVIVEISRDTIELELQIVIHL